MWERLPSLSRRACPVWDVDNSTGSGGGGVASVDLDACADKDGEVESPDEELEDGDGNEDAPAGCQILKISFVAVNTVGVDGIVCTLLCSPALPLKIKKPRCVRRHHTAGDGSDEPDDEAHTDMCAWRDALVSGTNASDDEFCSGPEEGDARGDDHVECDEGKVAVERPGVYSPSQE